MSKNNPSGMSNLIVFPYISSKDKCLSIEIPSIIHIPSLINGKKPFFSISK